jgi:hypothetical protein
VRASTNVFEGGSSFAPTEPQESVRQWPSFILLIRKVCARASPRFCSDNRTKTRESSFEPPRELHRGVQVQLSEYGIRIEE